jgi:hypothetical protein
MRFSSKTVTFTATGRQAKLFLPEELHNSPSIRPGDTYTDISVDGIQRVAVASVIRMGANFTSELSRRNKLGHDCGVFALACESGNAFADDRFNGVGGRHVAIGKEIAEYLPGDAPEIQPGGIVLTKKVEKTNPNQPICHMLVRATADPMTPLYMSKFGENGPVALSTLDASLAYYAADTISFVSDLRSE